MAPPPSVKYRAFVDTREEDVSVRSSVSVRRIVSSAFGVAVVAGILWVGAEFKKTTKSPLGLVLVPAHRSAALTRDFTLRGQTGAATTNMSTAGVAPIELAEISSVKCWKETGETCNVQQCTEWRHATCERQSCNCPDGCVGADFSCHASRNGLVSAGFQLTNGRWPSSYLYVPRSSFLSQLRVGGSDSNDNRFVLYEVPGTHDGRKKYVMTSREYPDHVVAVQPTGNAFGGQWKGVDVASSSPGFVLWTICRPRNYNGPNLQFGIGNNDIGYIWVYVHRFSYLVYGWDESSWGLPDDRAQWTPSVPLKFDYCP
eukprot:TRINITY_DN4119_c0_g1_i2.p1 TRINITY_DN4119_c0_g1~~TRINITY_DN4119_c0_g1_i2.p1  ORF type:complete len:341 (-),score=35.88 TRINITY_DN4119_c0_g1_i2:108-1049(-)